MKGGDLTLFKKAESHALENVRKSIFKAVEQSAVDGFFTKRAADCSTTEYATVPPLTLYAMSHPLPFQFAKIHFSGNALRDFADHNRRSLCWDILRGYQLRNIGQ